MEFRRFVFRSCRGFQEINVALGGTLRRDTSASGDLLRHHAPDGVSFGAMFDHHHKVDLIEGGLLASAYGAQSLDVNSVHYQGVDQLADGLAVEARAPDGLVEAYRSSEEHTSELQSLLRSSYAVFCLKNNIDDHDTTH